MDSNWAGEYVMVSVHSALFKNEAQTFRVFFISRSQQNIQPLSDLAYPIRQRMQKHTRSRFWSELIGNRFTTSQGILL
jgi:hypothetical protein